MYAVLPAAWQNLIHNMREMGYHHQTMANFFFTLLRPLSEAIGTKLFTFAYTLLLYSTTLTTSTEKWCYASAILSRLLEFI